MIWLFGHIKYADFSFARVIWHVMIWLFGHINSADFSLARVIMLALFFLTFKRSEIHDFIWSLSALRFIYFSAFDTF